jgi:hypothetical protein
VDSFLPCSLPRSYNLHIARLLPVFSRTTFSLYQPAIHVNLAAAVGAQMPAVQAAFEIIEAQSAQGQEQDFSAVILEMEKKAHLGFGENGGAQGGAASAEKQV